MSPASFAIITLTALFVATQIVKLVFELTAGAEHYQPKNNQMPSGIA